MHAYHKAGGMVARVQLEEAGAAAGQAVHLFVPASRLSYGRDRCGWCLPIAAQRARPAWAEGAPPAGCHWLAADVGARKLQGATRRRCAPSSSSNVCVVDGLDQA